MFAELEKAEHDNNIFRADSKDFSVYLTDKPPWDYMRELLAYHNHQRDTKPSFPFELLRHPSSRAAGTSTTSSTTSGTKFDAMPAEDKLEAVKLLSAHKEQQRKQREKEEKEKAIQDLAVVHKQALEAATASLTSPAVLQSIASAVVLAQKGFTPAASALTSSSASSASVPAASPIAALAAALPGQAAGVSHSATQSAQRKQLIKAKVKELKAAHPYNRNHDKMKGLFDALAQHNIKYETYPWAIEQLADRLVA